MLSFLRDQGNQNQSENPAPDKAPANTNQTAGNVTDEQQYLTVAGKNSDLKKNTILLAVFFAVGLGLLFFMIKKTNPPKAAAANTTTEEAKLEAAISRLTGIRSEMFSKMDQIIKKFYEFSDVRQVSTSELAKNPFKHDQLLGNISGLLNQQDNTIDLELVHSQKIRNRAKDLELFSVMKSDQPELGVCCMINDKILNVGDSIEGFTITSIHDRFVVLTSDGTEIILRLDE